MNVIPFFILYNLLLLSTLLYGVFGVEMQILSPLSVESGTRDVILDCQLINSTGFDKLVLKWYFNDERQPIYQWIPGIQRRTFSPKYQQFVDTNFRFNDNLPPYRGLKLLRPGVDRSGRYTCSVTSMEDHNSESTRLVIYSGAKLFEFDAKPMKGGYNITCEAEGLFPTPQMILYRYIPAENASSEQYNETLGYDIHGAQLIQLTRENMALKRQMNGLYQISLSSFVETMPKSDQTIIYECVLSIPSTTYMQQRRLEILPERDWFFRRILVSAASQMTPDYFVVGYSVFSILQTLFWCCLLKL